MATVGATNQQKLDSARVEPRDAGRQRRARATVAEPPLPAIPAGADLACGQIPLRWPAGLFVAAFLVYLAFVPYFLLYDSPPTGDQPYYLIATISLVQDGDLNVKNNYDQHDEEKFYTLAPHPPDFVGMSAPNPLPRQIADSVARPDTEEYSAHLPGLPVLLAPAWAIGGIFALWWPATIVLMCLIGALLTVNAFLLAYEITGRRAIALAVWAALAFSNPLMTYSYLIFTELPTGLLLIYAIRRLARGWADNAPWRLLLIGACIAYIPWLAWRCVLVAAPLGLYAAVQWWRWGHPAANADAPPPPARRQTFLSALWVVGPIVVSAALLVYLSLFRFGTLIPTGDQARGQAEVFYWPWAGRLAFTQFLNNGFGLLFDIQWGLLIYAPVYLLAGVGLVAMIRSGRPADRRLLGVLVGCAAVYWFVIMSYKDWNGEWCPPARYQTTFVALLAAPLAMSLWAARHWLYRVLFAALAVVGFSMMAVMLFRPIRMFPFGDGKLFFGGVFDWLARWPDLPFHVDLTHTLPSFITPDELRQPATTGAILLAAFAVVSIGVALTWIPGHASLPRLRAVPVPLLAWAGVTVVLGAGWLNINADYLRSRTLLEEQQRWPLPAPLSEAHGIAYLDGNIYIASLGPRSEAGELQPGAGELGRLDLDSGMYTPIQPIGADGVFSYTLPGDVKAGPDGLLYLLNNGPGTQAVLVMQPDGHVVRELPLDEKLTLAEGLLLGPGNDLYITDMALVRQYGSNGGVPKGKWGGQDNEFVNVMGLALTPDGHIYAAESSRKRVQELDSSGRVVATHDLRCQPYQAAVQGDWVDVLCDQGLRSINWHSGELRIDEFAAGSTPLQAPTAMTYGLDGTLYILDTDAVVAYSVDH